MHLRFVPSFVCLVLMTMEAAFGEPPRLDRYGDALPPGVVARLGTERLAPGYVACLAFSPDGRRLAAHNGSDKLWIWEVKTGKELLRLKLPAANGARSGATCLAFSPDGKAFAVRCQDRAVRVWETETGKELQRLGGLPGPKSSLAFSPDGRSLFAGGSGSPILCWDLTGAGKLREIGDFSSTPFVALSRDGKTVTAGRSAFREGQKWLFARWDIASGKEIGRQILTLFDPWSGALSPDGHIFARPEEDGKTITVFDPRTGRELARAQGSNSPVFIAFSADGSAMTCRSKDGNVHVWDTATGKVRARFKALSTRIDRVVLSPDGKRLALVGRADDAIHLWDVQAGRELHSFTGHRSGPLTVAFLKDGKEIATTSRDSYHTTPINAVSRDNSPATPITAWADWSLRRWDAATGTELAATAANPKGEVHYTVFSADGRQLATVINDGTLRLWDVESGKELRSWKVPTGDITAMWEDGKGGKTVLKTPYPAISEPAFSPNGKTLFAAQGAKVRRWEVATGRELPPFEIEGIMSAYGCDCFPSPDGRTLLVHTGSGRWHQALLLDARSGKLRLKIQGIEGWAQRPTFSRDGRTLAVGDAGAVSLWETTSGRPRGRLKGARRSRSLAFSPDGRFLAAGAEPESQVNLWNLATAEVAGQFEMDRGRVQSLAFSPDGLRLAVAGYFPTVLVCDVAALCDKKKIEETVKEAVSRTAEFEGVWTELCGSDSVAAYRAIRRLALTGPRGAEFLKTRLQDTMPVDERRIAQLIADLDDDAFAAREKASAQLRNLGVRAEPVLRRTLENKPSLEVRRRINQLLERLDTKLPTPELIRLRLVEALEANASPEARQALAEVAETSTDAELTREAKASLARLARRAKKP